MQHHADINLTQVLLERLQEAGSFVLASPEDAEFFRAEFAKKTQAHPKPLEVAPPHEIPIAPPVEKKEIPSSLPPKAQIKPALPTVKAAAAEPAPIKENLHEEPISPPKADFGSLRTILKTAAPELAILHDIPNDLIARKISERWKTKNQAAPISILCWQEPPEQKALLEQIARALDVYFGGARMIQVDAIEKEKQWEAFLSVADLKTIIVCDYTLWQLNHLMQFYKETPAQGTRVLGNIPLFLLPDLSLYLKDHLLKRSLWKALCQRFA